MKKPIKYSTKAGIVGKTTVVHGLAKLSAPEISVLGRRFNQRFRELEQAYPLKGKAICSDLDTFDKEKGMKIATARSKLYANRRLQRKINSLYKMTLTLKEVLIDNLTALVLEEVDLEDIVDDLIS